MANDSNGQSERLTREHKATQGAQGIFGTEARAHDLTVARLGLRATEALRAEFPRLTFRHRASVRKEEINAALRRLDPQLGQTLYVHDAAIKPDGGLVEVKDDSGDWRIILVAEAKYQGKDTDNIRQGIKVGKGGDQDLMLAGNAIERAHKNIREMGNLMLAEDYFPYVLFLEGSNFLTQDVTARRPDGTWVTLACDSGSLNRLDRLTSANYGLPVNTDLTRNRYVPHGDKMIMLQAASIYTRGDGGRWSADEMLAVMLGIARTSLQILGRDLFKQLTAQPTTQP